MIAHPEAGTLVPDTIIVGGLQKSYQFFKPKPLPQLQLDSPTIKKLEEANFRLGELKGITKNIGSLKLFISMYKRKEAVLSSRIEGTRVSLTDLFLTEAGKKDTRWDMREVLNFIETLDFALTELKHHKKIDKAMINQMHYMLLRNVRGSKSLIGDYRNVQNWIGKGDFESAEFIPPAARYVNELMEYLFRFMQEENVPKLIKLGLMHYYFETIHPYEDGNGRLGRTLVLLYLIQLELLEEPLLYLSPYFERNQEKYYDLLMKIRTDGDYTTWLLFFLEGISQISSETSAKVEKLIDLYNEYTEKLKQSHATSISYSLLDKFFENPYSQISVLQTQLHKNYPLIRRGIEHLKSQNIVHEISRTSRNKFYVAHGILNIIEH